MKFFIISLQPLNNNEESKMKLSQEQQTMHHKMWNQMDLKALKEYVQYLNPKLNIKMLEQNLFWNDLLDLDYDRALLAFENCVNNIY